MPPSIRILLLAAPLLAASVLHAQATESSITNAIKGLRNVPDATRPAATLKIATDIRTLPPGQTKLKLADGLSHLATEGDPGRDALQAVASTLAQALSETPIPVQKDLPARPYMDLAKLVRYEHVTTDLADPLLARANQILAANDAEIEKVDFTLNDLHGRPVTLSALRGKIVLVNFWATWCPPCRKEMPDLDAIYNRFAPQGLVILSISDEDLAKVGSFIEPAHYRPPVLLDPDARVAKLFHVDGIPKSFVFDRQGKLVSQSIDMRTQRQFLDMLALAGLHN